MGGGGQCRKKNLLHWAMEAHVHKTTYGPVIHMALYVMLLMTNFWVKSSIIF